MIPYRIETLTIPTVPPEEITLVITTLVARRSNGQEILLRLPAPLKAGVDLDARTLEPVLNKLEEVAVQRAKKYGVTPVRYIYPPEETSTAMKMSLQMEIMRMAGKKLNG